MVDRERPALPLSLSLFDAPLNQAGYNDWLGGVFSDMAYRAMLETQWIGTDEEVQHSIDLVENWWIYLQEGRYDALLAMDVIAASYRVGSSVDGGTLSGGTWRDATLNTLDNDDTGLASLAANVLTVPAGTYLIFGYITTRGVGWCLGRCYNVTDAVDAATGSPNDEASGEDYNHHSLFFDIKTFAGDTDLKLQANPAATGTGDGWGAAQHREDNVYHRLICLKVG